MGPMSLTRILMAAIGGLLAGVLILGILAAVNGATGFRACTATEAFGWAVPIIAGLAVGAMSLLLLGSGRDQSEPPSTPSASACAECGSPIHDGWRLCPHCGSLLECDVAMPATSAHTLDGA